MSSLTHFSLTQLAAVRKIVSRPKKQNASSGWFIRASNPLKKNLIAGPTIRDRAIKSIIPAIYRPTVDILFINVFICVYNYILFNNVHTI